MSILEEIKNIEKEIKNTKKFSTLSELLSDMKKKIKESSEVDDEIVTYIIGNYHLIITNFRNFYRDWENGGNSKVKDEILENAEKLIKVVLNDLNRMTEEEFPEGIFGSNYLLNAKEFLNTLGDKIKEEKSRRQNGGGGGNNPPPSDNSEINKRISSLQSQISGLEQRQSQHPNSGDSEQTKQELTRLKSELAALKIKQNQQHDKNPQPNGFPWMALGAGIVIVILLLIIAFLYKKSKK